MASPQRRACRSATHAPQERNSSFGFLLESSMIADPWFYAAAVPAVILIGMSKGGFGGSISLIGVPLIALTVSPITAAGITLPILIAMDVVALLAYRRVYDKGSLVRLLPGAMLGTGIGWATAALVTDSHVRLILGLLILAFLISYWLRGGEARPPAQPDAVKGTLWGTLSGFTSFVTHAGGPPFQMYMLPLRLERRLYAGTSVVYFAILNAAKVGPYFMLGQFNPANLATSAVLMPLAPLATLLGVWLVRVVNQDLFYRVIYAVMVPVGLKLMWDGISGVVP
jgi:uncharacterized membrane protein YfcA